jgi:hypothetical protein
MFRILIDTCVWIELAKDPRQQSLLAVLEHVVQDNIVELILPRTIVEEFARNRKRTIEESNKSLSSALKRAKDGVARFADPKKRQRTMDHLNELEHKLPHATDTASNACTRIDALFAKGNTLEIDDSVRARCAQRAMDMKAPFHRGRNSIADAILVEMYADCVKSPPSKGVRYAFVTHNTKDFSQPGGSDKRPHADIASLFSKVRSIYFVTLGEALKRAAPEHVRDITFEEEWQQEPRSLTEILEAIDEFFDKVWYNRHMGLRNEVLNGQIEIVDGPYDYRDQSKIERKIWKGARKAAGKVLKKRGRRNLGPWDDFEWGMINGKLSALRWVLGDDWDMLDT